MWEEPVPGVNPEWSLSQEGYLSSHKGGHVYSSFVFMRGGAVTG